MRSKRRQVVEENRIESSADAQNGYRCGDHHGAQRVGKLHSYEIRGKNPADGKTREVRVSLSGAILEQE